MTAVEATADGAVHPFGFCRRQEVLAAPGRPSFDRYSHLPTSLFGSGVEVMSAIANRVMV
jgi:hypothetical protein